MSKDPDIRPDGGSYTQMEYWSTALDLIVEVAAGFIAVEILLGIVLNVKLLYIQTKTFKKEKSEPYFPLLLLIQLYAMSIPLLFLFLFLVNTYFKGVAAYVVVLVLYVFVLSAPSHVALLDWLLCLQRALHFVSCSSLPLSRKSFLIFYAVLFVPYSMFAALAMIGTIMEDVSEDQELLQTVVKSALDIDILLRFSMSLCCTLVYSYILYSVKRHTRKSLIKRPNDHMIIVQALPIAVFELIAAVVQLGAETHHGNALVGPYRPVIGALIVSTCYLVVPLSIVLGCTSKRQMFFSCKLSKRRPKVQPTKTTVKRTNVTMMQV